MTGVAALREETSSSLLPCEAGMRKQSPWRKWAVSAGTLILDFSTLELWEKQIFVFISPHVTVLVIAARPDEDRRVEGQSWL